MCAAFSWNEGFREYFAVKATPTPAILRLLRSLGCGADCASDAELRLAERCGMTGELVMFTSNETAPDEYRAAREMGAIINLDDITQLEMMERACGVPEVACCRFNPGEFSISNAIMGELHDSKFGMTKGQLFDALRALRAKGASRLGIHAMLASCSLDSSYLPSLARLLFSVTVEIKRELGIELAFIDLGGGIGIPYLPDEEPADIYKSAAGVRREYDALLRPEGLAPMLCTEMGRFVTGPHGWLVTSVIGHKHTHREYVGVDATACDLMRPAMYGAYHHITVLGREDDPSAGKFDVVGSLCENNDKFAVQRELPATEIGDIIVIHDAGAHGHAMGYNYNGKLRHAEFLMGRDRKLRMIRRAETLDDLFATLNVDEEFSWR